MAYLLTEEQRDLKKLIGDFMKGEVKPLIPEVDESGEFPVALYKKAFELGFHMLEIPEEYGGSGLDHETIGVLLEEMGYTEPGFAITLLCTALAYKCVLLGGTDKQKMYVSDLLSEGGFGAFCLTEPNSGSDAASLRTSYKKDGEFYVINGSKCFVTNGGYADVYIVFATKEKALGPKGISAFIVEKGTPGLEIGNHENKMGLRFSNTCDIFLTDVSVPAENLLGEEGKGFHIAMAGLDEGRLNNASIAVGLAQAALDEAIAYAKERKTFGKPIIKHQMIQTILADMATNVEAARQLVRYGMYALENNMPDTSKLASMSKYFCSDAAMKVTTDAVQILGGYGYSREYPVEKMMRDAKIFQIFEGTNQIQRMVVAREISK